MKYNGNNLIKKQFIKAKYFYGKSNDSLNCLKQSNENNKIRKINNIYNNTLYIESLFSISDKECDTSISSKNNKNHCIYISETKSDCIDLINQPNNTVKKIISSNLKINKTEKIDSSNFLSQKDKLMGTSQSNCLKNMDNNSYNLKDKNKSEVLKRVPSCSQMDEKDDILIDIKRPKLDHQLESNDKSKILNNSTPNLSINNGLKEVDQLNTQSNGSTKVCTCIKDQKICKLCFNSSPILLDEDDSASSSAENSNQSISSDKLFEYPKSLQTGRLTITKHDVKCLQPTEYLNDVIIDFYLKFINHNLLNKQERDKIHIFSSFFYSRLISVSSIMKNKNNNMNFPPDIAIQRHSRICNWTRNIDIFEKDFILIPINQHQHWFLAIICFPNMCKEIYDQFRDKLEDSKINDNISEFLLNKEKRPCILIFDSLCPNPERWDVSTILREYLQIEWNVRKNSDEGSNIFKKKIMRGNSVKCPQQANSYDCGCYLLLYAEFFFTRPIKSFHLPIRSCEHWFSTAEGSKMRDRLKNVVRDLTKLSIKDKR